MPTPSSDDQDIVIVAARRSPLGHFQGALSPLSAVDIAAPVALATLDSAHLDGADVDQVFMGCVLPAGLGQAPARQVALKAGLPLHVQCTTINKVCGSGMQAIMLGADAIRAGSANIVLAGGMESMTQAPYLLPKARGGYRLGHGEVIDHMFYDGLQNPYDDKLMGCFADATADHYSFSRAQQDAFAITSVNRAQAAIKNNAFNQEIVPLTLTTRKGEQVIHDDEPPGQCNIDKIPTLKPAFDREHGSVTAATSSSIADGAACVLLMTRGEARKRKIRSLATVCGQAGFAQAPEWFTTAPVGAIKALYKQTGWTDAEVDLYEINEAFAVVAMAAMHDLHLDHDKVNIHGGACALGHPIGATGARIVVTLIHALIGHQHHRGIASLCIGGGEATALALELVR